MLTQDTRISISLKYGRPIIISVLCMLFSEKRGWTNLEKLRVVSAVVAHIVPIVPKSDEFIEVCRTKKW